MDYYYQMHKNDDVKLCAMQNNALGNFDNIRETEDERERDK